MKKRIVITGLGLVSPAGVTTDEFYSNLIDGRSFIDRVKSFDVSNFNSQIAAECLSFNPDNYDIAESDRMCRYVQFAVAAAKSAVKDARIDFTSLNKWKSGVLLANAICGTPDMEREFLRCTENGQADFKPSLVDSNLFDASMFNAASAEISAMYGLCGINTTVSTGCTAGSDSLGLACELIQDGYQDLVIAGASEAPLCPITFGAFDIVQVLCSKNDEPAKASRPFDNKRSGFVISEGAGILILEELEHARRRNAPIYAEVIGYGSTCNAFHMTDLPEDGDAMASCIQIALNDACIKPEDVDYIQAHGSSTRQNDVFETNAYKTVFKEHAYKVKISSIKSMIGHALAAANSLELILSCLVFKYGYIPPTINQEERDPSCDLDYVPNMKVKQDVEYILKTSSGFSGIHSAVVLKRYREE